MANAEDKRAAKRISCPCDLLFEGVGVAESPINPRISDVSATGAFIDSMIVLPVGAVCKLRFPIGATEISVNARVCNSMPQFGMGVRFLDLTDEQRARIEQFVREQSQ